MGCNELHWSRENKYKGRKGIWNAVHSHDIIVGQYITVALCLVNASEFKNNNNERKTS